MDYIQINRNNKTKMKRGKLTKSLYLKIKADKFGVNENYLKIN